METDNDSINGDNRAASALYLEGTTQTDHADDMDVVDMEYHFRAQLQPQVIPAVSAWAMLAMTLLVLAAGTVVLRRQRMVV